MRIRYKNNLYSDNLKFFTSDYNNIIHAKVEKKIAKYRVLHCV